MSWELIKNKLTNLSYQELYDEHYGKWEVEKELPVGQDLRKRFYSKRVWEEVILKEEKKNENNL